MAAISLVVGSDSSTGKLQCTDSFSVCDKAYASALLIKIQRILHYNNHQFSSKIYSPDIIN